MIIYLSFAFRSAAALGNRAVPANRESAGRPATLRDLGAHRAAGRGRLPAALRLFPGPAGDHLAPPEGVGERRPGRVSARWAVRVLPHPACRARRIHGRASTADGGGYGQAGGARANAPATPIGVASRLTNTRRRTVYGLRR